MTLKIPNTHNTHKETLMSNPYELRFKVLEMARDLCHMDYYVQENAYNTLISSIEEAIRVAHYDKADELLRKIKELKPASPSSDLIKEKASELYEFVEQNGK